MKIYHNDRNRMTVITESDHHFHMFAESRVLITDDALPRVQSIFRYTPIGTLSRIWQYDRNSLTRLRDVMKIAPEYGQQQINLDCITHRHIGRSTCLITLLLSTMPLDMVMISPVRIIVERSLLPKIEHLLLHSGEKITSACLMKCGKTLVKAKKSLGVPVAPHKPHIKHNQTLPPDAFADLLDRLAEVEGCDPSQWQS